MVYYGAVSKGCQRCRQRRVKVGHMSYTPRPSPSESACHFFFNKYTTAESPLSEEYTHWLHTECFDGPRNSPLRTAIEATGLAGIANVYNAPSAATRSRVVYGRAISALKQSLEDPVQAASDTTLKAVIVLGTYEFITAESPIKFNHWRAHIDGATALLRLRGKDQFTSERGRQLFFLIRAQTLFACMRQEAVPPEALQNLSANFVNDKFSDTCFRLLGFCASFRAGSLTDHGEIHDTAVAFDSGLIAWAAASTNSNVLRYSTIDTRDAPPGTCFRGKRHIYSSPLAAEAWNAWRTMRILTNQVMLENATSSGTLDSAVGSGARDTIQQLSVDVCISAPIFVYTTRGPPFLWPLMVVSKEQENPLDVRMWATEKLRYIGSTMGIRQACLTADSLLRGLQAEAYHIGMQQPVFEPVSAY
ncbi:hypothetical protein GQ53DRAFT_812943 [Thozetella sp. PMI_491]|nr:hypothetical protein GQ53DRAFT_812943 [Thozetella sp. PMI_491]